MDFSKLYEAKSLSSLAEIYIKILQGASISIICLINSTIKNIKDAIERKEGFRSGQQLLFFNKIQLEDNKTLRDYNIQTKSTLHLYLKIKDNQHFKINEKS